MPAPGTAAPAFSLANQDGRTVNLADLAGKTVVLFAFPKANTSGCAAQAKGFHDNLPAIEAAGGVVFGVSPDPVADLKAWHDQEKFGFDLLSDPEHGTIEAYGAWGEKTLYGETSVGVIRSHWVIGPDGKIVDERLKVSPAQSVALATETVTSG